MNQQRKVDFTFYIEGDRISSFVFVDQYAERDEIDNKIISKKIKIAADIKGEVMSHWAKDLGVTRHALYHVKEGRRETKYIREFIENRLGLKVWIQRSRS